MNEDFFRIMEEHNPFYFRDKREHFIMFKDYSLLYEAMMERLYEQAPLGYIDLVLFLTDQCHMGQLEAADFLQNFHRSGAIDRRDPKGAAGVVMVDWKDVDTYKDTFANIAKGLHWLMETQFNPSMFNQGFNMFKLKYKMFQ